MPLLSDSVSLCPFHTNTHTNILIYRQLPHAPENPIAVLSSTEKRAINLTWAQAFDGNSPLIRYILEVSENSEWRRKYCHFILICYPLLLCFDSIVLLELALGSSQHWTRQHWKPMLSSPPRLIKKKQKWFFPRESKLFHPILTLVQANQDGNNWFRGK